MGQDQKIRVWNLFGDDPSVTGRIALRMRLAQSILSGILVCAAALFALAAARPAAAGHVNAPVAPAAACEPDRTQSSGAFYRICVPPPLVWQGDVVVYAHGYVTPSAVLT